MINVGIIGMGRSGWELHAAFLANFPGYRLVAANDRSPERLARAVTEFGVKPYQDAAGLIADPGVQLVVVSSPSNLHAAHAVAAMEAGKDVVVEKPMSITLAEADTMLQAADRTGRLLTVFHNRRWDRDYLMVKKIVASGVLGELLSVESRIMTFGPAWATYGVAEFNPQWRTQAAWGGGFLADWGPHLVEQCLDLTGEWPLSVSCQLRGQVWSSEVEDYFFLRLTFPSGLLFSLEGSNNARTPLPRWFAVGRDGTLLADGGWGKWTDMKVLASIGDMPVEIVPQGMGASSGGHSFDVGEELSACFYTDLAEALATGRPPAISARRGRNVMAILEAARKANASCQTVTLDPPL